MSSDRIRVERRGPILIVTMNRPEKLNALAPADSWRMRTVFEEFAVVDDLLVAIVIGAGVRAFTVGNDLGPRVGNG